MGIPTVLGRGGGGGGVPFLNLQGSFPAGVKAQLRPPCPGLSVPSFPLFPEGGVSTEGVSTCLHPNFSLLMEDLLLSFPRAREVLPQELSRGCLGQGSWGKNLEQE